MWLLDSTFLYREDCPLRWSHRKRTLQGRTGSSLRPWERATEKTTGGKPYLGTIPDYEPASIPGVLLDGVAPGGPAAKAGLRSGDIIVSLAGKKVETIHDYSAILDELVPEKSVTVEVSREGQRIKMFLTPGRR